jgi:hypothetical protein
MEAFVAERRRAELAAMTLERDEPGDDFEGDPEYVEIEVERLPAKAPEPPTPSTPIDLEPVEADMWTKVHAEHRLDDAKRAFLHSALQTHALIRKLREAIAHDGVTLLNRDDCPRPNPALIPLRQLLHEFNGTMQILGLRRW